jgi:hypothetical protein
VLLPGTTVTLSNAGAPDDTLVALVILFIIAAALIGPAFALLYFLQGHRLLGGQEPAARPDAVQAYPPEDPMTRIAAIGMVVVASIARRRRRT